MTEFLHLKTSKECVCNRAINHHLSGCKNSQKKNEEKYSNLITWYTYVQRILKGIIYREYDFTHLKQYVFRYTFVNVFLRTAALIDKIESL